MSSDVVGKAITTRTIDFIYNYKKDGTVVKHTITPSSSTSYLTSQSFTIPNVESGDVLVFNVPTLLTVVSYKMFLATWTWKGETFNTKTTTFPDTQFVDKSAYSSTTLTEPNRTTFANATGIWNLDPYYNSNTLKGAQFKWAVPVLFPKLPDSTTGNTTLNSKIVSDVKGYAVCFRRLYNISHYNNNKVLIKTYDIDTSTEPSNNQGLIYNFTIPNVAFGDTLTFKTNHDIYLTFDGVTTVVSGPYDASIKRFLATWTWNGQEYNSKTTLFKNTVYRTKVYNPDIDFTYNPIFINADAVWDAYDVGNTTKSAVFEWKAYPDRVNSNIFGPVSGNTVLEEEYSCNKGSIVTDISSTGSSSVPRIKCSDGKVLNKQSEIPTATVSVNQCTNPQKGYRGISSNDTGTQYGFTCGSAYPANWSQSSALPPQFSLPSGMVVNKSFTAPDGMALTGIKVYYDKTNTSVVKNVQGLYSYNPFDTVPLNQLTLSPTSDPPPLTTNLTSFNSIPKLPLLADPPLPPLPVSSDPSQYYYATANNYKWQYPVATMSSLSSNSKQTLSTDQCPPCATCQTCPPKPVPPGHVASDNFGVKSTSPYKVCQSGSNVSEIYGTKNDKNKITSYGMKCSNGVDLGAVGVSNTGDVPVSIKSCAGSNGFSGAYGYGSSAGLLKLAPKCNNSLGTTPETNFGVSAVSGGGVTVSPFNYTCPKGMVLSGYAGNNNTQFPSGSSIDNIQMLCTYNPNDLQVVSSISGLPVKPVQQVVVPPVKKLPVVYETMSSVNAKKSRISTFFAKKRETATATVSKLIKPLPVLPNPPLPDFPKSTDPSKYYYSTADSYKWTDPSVSPAAATAKCPDCNSCQVCPQLPVPAGHVASDNFGVKSTSPYKVCPSGSNVTEIYGTKNSKNQITSYGMRCSNGTDLGVVGVGGNGDVPVSIKSCAGSNGFSGAYGYGSSSGLLKLAPKCNNSLGTTPETNFGRSAVSGGGVTVSPFNYTCPKGMVLSGYSGNNNTQFPAGSSIDNVQMLCTYNPNDLLSNSSSTVGLPVKPVPQVVIPPVKKLPVLLFNETMSAKIKKKSFISTFFSSSKKRNETASVSPLIKPLPILPDPPLPDFPVSEDPLKYYYSSPGTYKYTPKGGVLPQSMCPECQTCDKCGIVPKKIDFNRNVQIAFIK